MELDYYIMPYSCKHCHDNYKTTALLNLHVCKTCKVCNKLCLCRNRTGAMYVPAARAAGIGSSSIFIQSQRAIGLELELSEFGQWKVSDKGLLAKGFLTSAGHKFDYTIVHDGSVRPSALEAVFDPVMGDQKIINCLNSIANHVYQNDCKVNDTCGYHVHVNAQDYGWLDIIKILKLWTTMEEETSGNLHKLSGRQPTDHCQEWTRWIREKRAGRWPLSISTSIPSDIKDFKSWFAKMLYNAETDTFKHSISNVLLDPHYKKLLQYYKEYPKDYEKPKIRNYAIGLGNYLNNKENRGWNRAVASRYLNLNLHSLRYRGTVEYRLGAGTIDPQDIRLWPLFCLWLTEAVSRTSLKLLTANYLNTKGVIGSVCPLSKIVTDGGILTPSFKGNVLYPLPLFLRNWMLTKINVQ